MAAGGSFSAILTRAGRVYVIGYSAAKTTGHGVPDLKLDFFEIPLVNLDSPCVDIYVGGSFFALVCSCFIGWSCFHGSLLKLLKKISKVKPEMYTQWELGLAVVWV